MRKKTQYIVVNEIYKTIYCGYPQKRAWKIITGSSGGMFLTDSKLGGYSVQAGSCVIISVIIGTKGISYRVHELLHDLVWIIIWFLLRSGHKSSHTPTKIDIYISI